MCGKHGGEKQCPRRRNTTRNGDIGEEKRKETTTPDWNRYDLTN